MKELKGIITAMVTPFDETEKMVFMVYSFAELMVNSICFPMTKKLS